MGRCNICNKHRCGVRLYALSSIDCAVMKLFHKAQSHSSPATMAGVTMPCIKIMQSLVSPSASSGVKDKVMLSSTLYMFVISCKAWRSQDRSSKGVMHLCLLPEYSLCMLCAGSTTISNNHRLIILVFDHSLCLPVYLIAITHLLHTENLAARYYVSYCRAKPQWMLLVLLLLLLLATRSASRLVTGWRRKKGPLLPSGRRLLSKEVKTVSITYCLV